MREFLRAAIRSAVVCAVLLGAAPGSSAQSVAWQRPPIIDAILRNDAKSLYDQIRERFDVVYHLAAFTGKVDSICPFNEAAMKDKLKLLFVALGRRLNQKTNAAALEDALFLATLSGEADAKAFAAGRRCADDRLTRARSTLIGFWADFRIKEVDAAGAR